MTASSGQSQQTKEGREARWKGCGSLTFCLDSNLSNYRLIVPTGFIGEIIKLYIVLAIEFRLGAGQEV